MASNQTAATSAHWPGAVTAGFSGWIANARLSSRIAVGTLLFIATTILLVVTLLGRHERERYLGDSGVQLALRTQLNGKRLAQEIDTLRQDALFLADTPPIQGIVRASGNHGLDPVELQRIETWHKRLGELFSAFAKARPAYRQLRFIGLAEDGRELVRVDAGDGPLRVTPASQLQRKGDRDYFQATLRLKPGEVYLSEFNLNRERGRVEVPHVRTLRAATPVYGPDGRLFGMVVINMDAGELLDGLTKNPLPGIRVYLMNDAGDYLVHPDVTRTFGFDLGRPSRWQQDFPGVPIAADADTDSARPPARLSSPSPDGGLHLAISRIHFDPMQPGRYLALAYALPHTIVEAEVAEARNIVIGGALASTLLIGSLFFLYVRRTLAPLQPLTAAAHEIGAGRYDVPLPNRGSGEVRALVDAFKSMQQRLELREREIRQLNTTLERQVLDRTSELLAANQELESFAYAVAHDLRAPLRAMIGFSQALVEDHAQALNPEARLYLDQIVIGGQRMGDLVDGLLTLSRSTRGELRREEVDLSALAERILDNLALAEPQRQVTRSIEPGLSARGDARMLEVLLRNLLGNAWKYTSARSQASIRMHGQSEDGRPWFCVSDNGAGFDMAHAGKLFQPFQRLHRQEEFAGIGIGLATVQRIVHRHGGEIRAEGTPGRGAQFSFSIGHYPADKNTNFKRGGVYERQDHFAGGRQSPGRDADPAGLAQGQPGQ